MSKSERIEIQNVLSPGHLVRVDAEKYGAMKQALLSVLPKQGPGVTAAELGAGIRRVLSQELFPGGAKAGWWMKAVQLDLEAKKVIVRVAGRPLRWHRC